MNDPIRNDPIRRGGNPLPDSPATTPTTRSTPPDGEARLDALLDRAVAALQDDLPADKVVAAAGQRAWSRIAAAAVGDTAVIGAEGQADYRSLIPDFLAGRLSSAQALLVADHIREDPAFRAEVEAARTGAEPRRLTAVAPRSPDSRAGRASAGTASWTGGFGRDRSLALVTAASLAVVAGTFLFARDLVQPNRVLAEVSDVSGGLMEVTDAGASNVLVGGDVVRPAQRLRAVHGGGAVVTLNDGSTIELGPRAEIALASRWNGTAVNLARGGIIVHAADQGRGRLHVATDDLDVVVHGTIFSVRHGTKGSRVSVVEGEVEVAGAQGRRTLAPGMQYTSRAAVGQVPVADDVAWSRHSAEYLRILEALDRLGQEIDASVARPAPRTASTLQGAVPADTALYIALPNLGTTVADAYTKFREGVAADPVLRDWWAKSMTDPEVETRLDALIAALSDLGDAVGEEIVVAAGAGDGDEVALPIILALVDDPAAFRVLLERKVAALSAAMGDERSQPAGAAKPPDVLRILTDRPALDAAVAAEAAADGSAGDAEDHMFVWLGGGPVVISPSAARVAAAVAGPRGLPAEFREAVTAAYRSGVDALLAVDVQALAPLAKEEALSAATARSGAGGSSDAAGDRAGDPASNPAGDIDPLDWAGLTSARFAVVTQVTHDDQSEFEADLTFAGRREGMASWLAEPGPLGALDFVSPDAYVAGAALIDKPERIVAEFLGLARSGDPNVLEDPDAAAGAEILADLSRSLGGEVAFAIDGPVLPKPSWKMVVEVTDATALQAALSSAVDRVNARIAREAAAGPAAGPGAAADAAQSDGLAESQDAHRRLVLTSTVQDGREVWTLAIAGDDEEGAELPAMHWLYADGYLLAASDPGLLAAALRTRASGVTLRHADAFVAALPSGEETDFSAVLWQDFGRLTRVLASGVGAGADPGRAGSGTLPSGLSDIATRLGPSLAYAWAQPDRLRFAATSNARAFGIGFLLQLLAGAAAGDDTPGPAIDGVPLPVPSLGGAAWEPRT